jgi:hypothetical protein
MIPFRDQKPGDQLSLRHAYELRRRSHPRNHWPAVGDFASTLHESRRREVREDERDIENGWVCFDRCSHSLSSCEDGRETVKAPTMRRSSRRRRRQESLTLSARKIFETPYVVSYWL